MLWMSVKQVLVVAVISATCLLPAVAKFTGRTPVLKAGVQLSDKLPALDARLSPGLKFDVESFSQAPYRETWVQIPEWLAGQWQQEERTRIYRRNEATGEEDVQPSKFKSERLSRKGYQLDPEGGIWDLLCSGITEEIKGDGTATCSLLVENDPVSVEENKVVISRKTIDVWYNTSTRQILDAYQTEEIETYWRESPDTIKLECSMKTFSREGSPSVTLKLVSSVKRIGKFTAINEANGKNVHDSFLKYLKTNSVSSSP